MRHLVGDAARQAIIDAANRRRIHIGAREKPYTRRHLQWCVFVCRQGRLVSDDTLIAAGFNR